MNPDEIYLANFPFGGSARMKLRPVLLLTGSVGSVLDVLVAYISSVIPLPLLPSDLVLDPATVEHASTNLKTTSVKNSLAKPQEAWHTLELLLLPWYQSCEWFLERH